MVKMSIGTGMDSGAAKAMKTSPKPSKDTPPVVITAPTLSGAGKIGAVMTTSLGVWGGSPAAGLSARWQRDGADIPGAEGARYTPVPADDRADLRCVVTASNRAGTLAAATVPVRITHAPPVVAGGLADRSFDLASGTREIETAGGFAGDALIFSVTGAGASIDPATGLVSIPTSAALDAASVTVTASNSGGSAAITFGVTVALAGSAPSVLSAPVLSGTGRIGSPVNVVEGVWSGVPAPSLALQWQRDGVDISGSTGASYTTVPSDDMTNLRCVVTASNTAGTLESATTPLRVTYEAPTAAGGLFDEVFDQGTGIEMIPTAQDFSGENLSFSVSGAGVDIDPKTGVVSLDTAVPLSGEAVTVTAMNSGGSAESIFVVTVEDGSVETQPVTLTDAIIMGDVTFAFADLEMAGVYCTGDPFVVSVDVVSITGMSPGHALSGTNTRGEPERNGAMINPGLAWPDFQAGVSQGFDARTRNGDGSALRAIYDGALNVDPQKTGAPVVFAPGATGSLVKAVSGPETFNTAGESVSPYSGGMSAVKQFQVLTVAPAAPPAGAFRPPVRGADKSVPANWTEAVMLSNMGMFGAALNPDGIYHGGVYPHRAAERAGRLRRLRQVTGSWFSTVEAHWQMGSGEGINHYGREYANEIGCALIDLQSNIPLAEKNEIAKAIVQIGIDNFGLVRDGGSWQDNGGLTHGRMATVLIAGLLLGDEYMLNAALDPVGRPLKPGGGAPGRLLFSEQKIFSYVTESPKTALPGTPGSGWGAWIGSGGGSTSAGRSTPIALPSEMLGFPEWGIRSYNLPSANSAHPSASYRDIVTMPTIIAALPMMLLNTAVDLSALNVMFDYADRMAGIYRYYDATGLRAKDAGQDPGYHRRFVTLASNVAVPYVDFYQVSRGLAGRTVWTDRPEMCMPPDVSVNGSNITVTAYPWEIGNGHPIIRRDLRWSQDGGAEWTVLRDVPGTHSFNVPLALTETLVQVRVANSRGEGAWSSNLPMKVAGGPYTIAYPAESAKPSAVAISGAAVTATLSSATALKSGTNGYSGTVTTDAQTGVLYHVVTGSATAPTQTQLEAGLDHVGAAAAADGAQGVSAPGIKTVSGSGLTPGTGYFLHYMHKTADGTRSAVVSSPKFTTGLMGFAVNESASKGVFATRDGYRIWTGGHGDELAVTSGGDVGVLIVGGGGGGGARRGGGGGAGEVVIRDGASKVTLFPSTYVAAVGEGGAGGVNVASQGSNGGDTTFADLTARGGGGGGTYSSGLERGFSGGSGGGGGAGAGGIAGGFLSAGSGGVGFAGGNGALNQAGGGGGGGAGGAGQFIAGAPGSGGPGVPSRVPGETGRYGGGGGGGAIVGASGTDGGGNGGVNGAAAPAAGAPGTGSGGGGGADDNAPATNRTGGRGGSGVVKVWWPV